MIAWHDYAMGYLLYDSHDYEFDDRTRPCESRHHGQAAQAGELSAQLGDAARAWQRPNLAVDDSEHPLGFRFSGSRAPALNETWVQVLHDMSNSTRGLVIVSEKEAEAHAASR